MATSKWSWVEIYNFTSTSAGVAALTCVSVCVCAMKFIVCLHRIWCRKCVVCELIIDKYITATFIHYFQSFCWYKKVISWWWRCSPENTLANSNLLCDIIFTYSLWSKSYHTIQGFDLRCDAIIVFFVRHLWRTLLWGQMWWQHLGLAAFPRQISTHETIFEILMLISLCMISLFPIITSK